MGPVVPGEVNSQRALVLGVLGSGGWMMGGRAARRAVGWGGGAEQEEEEGWVGSSPWCGFRRGQKPRA